MKLLIIIFETNPRTFESLLLSYGKLTKKYKNDKIIENNLNKLREFNELKFKQNELSKIAEIKEILFNLPKDLYTQDDNLIKLNKLDYWLNNYHYLKISNQQIKQEIKNFLENVDFKNLNKSADNYYLATIILNLASFTNDLVYYGQIFDLLNNKFKLINQKNKKIFIKETLFFAISRDNQQFFDFILNKEEKLANEILTITYPKIDRMLLNYQIEKNLKSKNSKKSVNKL